MASLHSNSGMRVTEMRKTLLVMGCTTAVMFKCGMARMHDLICPPI